MFLGPPWKSKPQCPWELRDVVCEQRSFVFSIFQGRMRLHLPSQWKKIWAWKMKIWKEEEDLEEDVEVGEHWPIERGSLPNGKCLGQPLAASAGKGMVTNFFGLAKSRSTLMMNFSFLLCQILLSKKLLEPLFIYWSNTDKSKPFHLSQNHRIC